jgi:hypothetical protein
MRLVAIAVVAAFVAGAVSGANAEPVKKRAVYMQAGPGSTTIISRDEQGRTRTKILVQKRSYLDGGTEIMPGDVQGHRTNFIDNSRTSTGMSLVPNESIVPGRPVTDPFFLPGKNNPYFN